MLRKLFLVSVVVILLTTSVAKLGSFLFPKAAFNYQDPVFMVISVKYTTLVAILLELGAVSLILWKKVDRSTKLWAIVWLCSLFVFYRLSLFLLKASMPCPCLGYAGDWLKIPAKHLELILKCTIVYMLAGSLSWLIADGRRSKLSRQPVM